MKPCMMVRLLCERLIREEDGQAMAEYAILITGLAGTMAASIPAFRAYYELLYTQVASWIIRPIP
jgi:Flp pilus assembly pilin Flp